MEGRGVNKYQRQLAPRVKGGRGLLMRGTDGGGEIMAELKPCTDHEAWKEMERYAPIFCDKFREAVDKFMAGKEVVAIRKGGTGQEMEDYDE
jgi:hypothetical protein